MLSQQAEMATLRITATAVVACIPLALAEPAAAYDSTVRCAGRTVRHVGVVTRSPEAVVFRRHRPTSHGQASVAYACLLVPGSIWRLKGSDFTRRQLAPQLAGRFVAFREILELNEFGSVADVVVLDIKTGKIKVEQSAMPGSESGSRPLLSFVVKRNGSVAWLGLGDSSEAVWKVDLTTGAEPQRLDSSPPAIGQESFRLSPDRRRVLWTKGKGRRSAPLN